MPEAIRLLLIGAGIIFLFMSALWYTGKKIGNYAIVDVGWAAALAILALAYFILGEGFFLRKIIITSMVCFWAIRLGGYLLFTRILGGHGEDERYTAFRKDYGDAVDRKFFTNIFQFQGLLDVFLSLPFLISCINPNPEMQIWEWIALGLFIFAVLGEALADRQLHSFKKDAANKGKNCEVGLWKYSRHPNYFFEWLIWVSYSLFSIAPEFGIFGYSGILPMIVMFIFLTKFSGIPMTEKQALLKRGDVYREYQRTTSAFIPWFKKA